MTADPSLGALSWAGADPGEAPEPVLRTRGLTVRFGGLTALNGIDLELQRDEIRAVIGPNGAGKSTFFNCLTGFLRPTVGRILRFSTLCLPTSNLPYTVS